MSWWAWALAGLVMLVGEVTIGGQILLGFVVGAAAMAVLSWLEVPFATDSTRIDDNAAAANASPLPVPSTNGTSMAG